MATPRLDRLLDEPLACDPAKLALACGDRRVSYAELSDLERRIATALHDADLAGERVAFLLPNSIELVVCYLGCWRAGVTAVPFEYVDAPPEIAYGLRDSEARWLIVHEEKLADLARIELEHTTLERILVVGTPATGHARFDDLLAVAPRALPDVASDAIAFILYTSGSTALPKGVEPLTDLSPELIDRYHPCRLTYQALALLGRPVMRCADHGQARPEEHRWSAAIRAQRRRCSTGWPANSAITTR